MFTYYILTSCPQILINKLQLLCKQWPHFLKPIMIIIHLAILSKLLNLANQGTEDVFSSLSCLLLSGSHLSPTEPKYWKKTKRTKKTHAISKASMDKIPYRMWQIWHLSFPIEVEKSYFLWNSLVQKHFQNLHLSEFNYRVLKWLKILKTFGGRGRGRGRAVLLIRTSWAGVFK